MVVAASAVRMFSPPRTERLVSVEGKMNAATYRDTLDDNLLHRATSSNRPTILSTQSWIQDNSVNVLDLDSSKGSVS